MQAGLLRPSICAWKRQLGAERCSERARRRPARRPSPPGEALTPAVQGRRRANAATARRSSNKRRRKPKPPDASYSPPAPLRAALAAPGYPAREIPHSGAFAPSPQLAPAGAFACARCVAGSGVPAQQAVGTPSRSAPAKPARTEVERWKGPLKPAERAASAPSAAPVRSVAGRVCSRSATRHRSNARSRAGRGSRRTSIP